MRETQPNRVLQWSTRIRNGRWLGTFFERRLIDDSRRRCRSFATSGAGGDGRAFVLPPDFLVPAGEARVSWTADLLKTDQLSANEGDRCSQTIIFGGKGYVFDVLVSMNLYQNTNNSKYRHLS